MAYRILGSLADAEDAVQDTFIKWSNIDSDSLDNAQAWLTTVCTRHCLDMHQRADRTRVDYTGVWLPEPIHHEVTGDASAQLELASSLTTAFLLMLQRLTPKERAAYLLYEIFGEPYGDVARILSVAEPACRQLVSRAKRHIDKDNVRYVAGTEQQNIFLEAFKMAVNHGDITVLSELLADDISLNTDGGGRVPAILKPLYGRERVCRFVGRRLSRYWVDLHWSVITINGTLGIVVKDKETNIHACVSFLYDTTGRVTTIYIMRNPDKLKGVDRVELH